MNPEDTVLAAITELEDDSQACAQCGLAMPADAVSSAFCGERCQETWTNREYDVSERPMPAEIASWLSGGAAAPIPARRSGRMLEITNASDYVHLPALHARLVEIGQRALGSHSGIDFTQPVQTRVGTVDFQRDVVSVTFSQTPVGAVGFRQEDDLALIYSQRPRCLRLDVPMEELDPRGNGLPDLTPESLARAAAEANNDRLLNMAARIASTYQVVAQQAWRNRFVSGIHNARHRIDPDNFVRGMESDA